MKHSRLLHILIALTLLLSASPVFAQSQPGGPVYVVQSGDTLNIIAARFNVSVDDLIAVNNIENPNMLAAGQELVIPGLQGVQGKLITEPVPVGENLETLSRKYNIPIPMLVKLNRLTSPIEAYAGSNLIIPQSETSKPLNGEALLASGESLLEAAVMHGTNPWTLVGSNHLSGTWDALPGSAMYYAAPEDAAPSSTLPMISSLSIGDLPLVQGGTVAVKVTTQGPLQLSGSLAGRELHFFPVEQGKNDYIALQGMHAMTPAGLIPLVLKGMGENGQSFEMEQMVLIQAGGYAKDPPLSVDPETLDPAITKPEEDEIAKLVAPASPARYWTGMFRTPVDEPVCIKSWYGNRRSYNGGDYTFFHTGVDYGVCANLNIYAPAPGVVVFAGPLNVRGNATIIDHGWGVYSGIYHQSEIKVKVGDKVDAGQLIGLIGKTGRVTGPHLHWDVFVGGIQVQPLDWLEKEIP